MNIYTDEPAKKDIFDGKAHDKLATRLSEIAQLDNVSIIGLDGYLGSGKSTIIDMAIEKIESDQIHIMKFDSEIYHYGATKKALIDIIYDGFKKTPGVNHDNLSKCKDYALGNIYNYTKKVNSKISLWTLSFICSTVISLQTLRFFISDLPLLLIDKPIPTSQSLHVLIEFFVVFSPLIVGGLYMLTTDVESNDDGKVTIKKPSFGDILKRNGEDTITEKIIVNKEVGTLELKSALEGFISCTPENARLILIIDNLDRISPSKIKEIWSDIELITEVAGKKLKILIPYSGKHVAKALSEDQKEGLEFISKRIPVTFFVPPLISAGWRNGFKGFWEETFGKENTDECYYVCELIERWIPKNYSSVTPRFMKRIINDINITSLTSPEFPLHRVLIAFYILLVRYSLVDFKLLISDYSEGEKYNDENLDVERMRASHIQFNNIFNSRDEWKKGLICIHFQTNSEFAISELIDEPLVNSIKYKNSQEFIEISKVYGFDKAWKKILINFNLSDLVGFMGHLSNENIEQTRKILPQVISRLNKDYPMTDDHNKELTREIIRLNKIIPFDINEKFILNRMNFLRSRFGNPNGLLQAAGMQTLNFFEEINIFLGLSKKKFTQYFPQVTGDIYFSFLIGWDNNYPNLNISEIQLTEEELIGGLDFALTNNIVFDLFESNIIDVIRINDRELEKIIEKDDFKGIEDIYQAFTSKTHIDSIQDFRKLCLSQRWRLGTTSQYFSYQNHLLSQHQNDYYAALIAQKVISGDTSPTANISNIVLNEEITNLLYAHLHFAKNLNVIVQGLENKEINSLISKAVKKIIINRKVKRLNTEAFIRDMYGPIKELVGKEEALSFFSGWDNFAKDSLSDKDHDNINQDFIFDLAGRDDFPEFKKAIREIVEKKLSSKDVAFNFINEPGLVYIKMLDLLRRDEIRIGLSNHSRIFSEYYLEESLNDLLKLNHMKNIISIIDRDVLDETVKAIKDILERNDLDPQRQIFAIRDFGDYLRYEFNISRNDNRAIARLFLYAKDYDFLARWLDDQKYALSKWNREDKKTVETFVLGNSEIFPKLLRTNYFKRRVLNGNDIND